MDMKLAGKVVVITGASTGLGRGIALKLAEEGACLVIGDISEASNPKGFDEQPERTTAQLIIERGGQAIFQHCDVTRSADLTTLVQAATERFGRLDIMINNAGVYRDGKLIHEFSEQELDLCLNVNVKGSFFGAQAAIKAFLSQGGGGNIINLVSTAGLQGHPWQSVYNISKGAQANLTRCLAIEYGHHGIRVNGICPTYAKTALTRALMEQPGYVDDFAQTIPLKRWGEIEDVADLAVFLASDRSSYIHGALVRIDGGETLSRYSV
ncbi:SDR family NAD(P)-dependent oxidoreductase [Pseudomonas sp. NPDC087358]|uniref:SDR family NAD(P)-dependent oxidoreductase n=1 Tax=Pseudomonas sp. NPDC087358 TaxID=3364439 RepID=UPI00384EF6EF